MNYSEAMSITPSKHWISKAIGIISLLDINKYLLKIFVLILKTTYKITKNVGIFKHISVMYCLWK